MNVPRGTFIEMQNHSSNPGEHPCRQVKEKTPIFQLLNSRTTNTCRFRRCLRDTEPGSTARSRCPSSDSPGRRGTNQTWSVDGLGLKAPPSARRRFAKQDCRVLTSRAQTYQRMTRNHPSEQRSGCSMFHVEHQVRDLFQLDRG